jgi:formate-dependent nitrite reductase membrane component NrfD
MVADAEFTSYYGRPVLKGPVWKVPDVPSYLYLGGLAGSSALMAALAERTGRPGLRRVGRLAAAAGSAAGAGALVHDLGRPERFLNMLRMVKPTSPLSVGSWILAPFGALSAAAAGSELTGLFPRLGRLAGLGSATLGPPLTTYTAVLLANTAVPAWHEAYPELPFLFAGSALASAGAGCMLATPRAEAGPARAVAALGAAMEIAAGEVMERRLGLAGEPYREGRAGRLMRAGRLLAAGGGLLAAVAGRGRTLTALSGLALTAGALCTRFSILAAGRASAADPKYTVVPQRERLNATSP